MDLESNQLTHIENTPNLIIYRKYFIIYMSTLLVLTIVVFINDLYCAYTLNSNSPNSNPLIT